ARPPHPAPSGDPAALVAAAAFRARPPGWSTAIGHRAAAAFDQELAALTAVPRARAVLLLADANVIGQQVGRSARTTQGRTDAER
ncbi:hypothetical protein, partial [Streptomyces sp. IBSBF 2435]|uniref:hypothetical protein n=1 Tax=Streptomyces sp. IBSBF 2435 TaxID=2903531 RepID=UPI002FDC0EE4